jgi:hypothetical protein
MTIVLLPILFKKNFAMTQQPNKLECLFLSRFFSGQYILVECNISSNDNCPTANIIQKFTLPMAQQQQK